MAILTVINFNSKEITQLKKQLNIGDNDIILEE
jgi:hypothetical protein